MTSGPQNGRSTLILCCVLIGLGSVTHIQSFAQLFSHISLPQGKSLGELARKKIADLHSLRSQLENKRLLTTSQKILGSTTLRQHDDMTTSQLGMSNGKNVNPLNPGKSTLETTPGDKWLELLDQRKKTPVEERISLFPSMWDSLRSVFSMKSSRDGFLSRILPNSQALLKLIKMRNEMDPNLRDYLTSKYNNLLTKLEPYSDGMGIPPFVLNSMKISSQSQDLHWYYIEKLLETTTVVDLIHRLPDFSSSSSNSLSSFDPDPIQSRVDDELISDQEPDATIKGHKKKYTSYGIRLGNGQRRPTKGDLADAATSATNIVGPDRTGYEYSSYADQYGLYGHDSYDTYGKGHDDYSTSHKGYGGSGHSGGGHGGGGGHKGGHYGGTGKGHGGHSSSYGHSTYYSPKSYGSSGGDHYSSGSSYGHSSGWGYGGGGGHGMNGFLDPFSILGTLAFLTYLGLLFQRSTQPVMMVNMTGRGFPRHLDPEFEEESKKPIELTTLNFEKDGPEKALKKHDRQIRSLEKIFDDEDDMSPFVLEDTWREIDSITHINEEDCRQLKLCYLLQDIGQTSLLSIFQEALEKWEVDRKYLQGLYNKTDTTEGITCGDSELSLDCNKIKPEF